GRGGWDCPRPEWASTGRRTTRRSDTRPHTAVFGCTSRTPSGSSTTSISALRSSSRTARPGEFAGYTVPRADVAQLVEHQLPKLRVAGSNPVVRSSGFLAGPLEFRLAPGGAT